MFDQTTLITNYKIMKDASLITAENDEGSQYTASDIKAANEKKDIAILQLSTPAIMMPLDYSVDPLRQEERITVIGSPDGLRNTASFGKISTVFTEDDVNWIQTTVPVSAGNSGDPLFNEAGKVIGITSTIRPDSQNNHFAINISEAAELFDSWDQSLTPLGQKSTETAVPLNPEDYVGNQIWDFTIKTTSGSEFTLSEALKTHELVLVNLWATWCPPCRAEFPFLEEAWGQYKDKVCVVALSVEAKDTMDIISKFAEQYGLTFLIGRDETNLFGRLGGMYIPTTLIVGADRKILSVEVGGKPSVSAFTEWFDRYLAKK